MGFLKETVDFNSDGEFTDKDLDVAWAYLQAKELYKLEQQSDGDKTINEGNFADKVKEVYNNNKASNIGRGGAGDISIKALPGFIKSGAALTVPKSLKFKHFWTFTDVKSTGVLDAATGTLSTYTNCNWTTSTNFDAPLFNFGVNGSLLLNDQNSIRNDRNWALFLRGKTRTSVGSAGGILCRKGGFEVEVASPYIRVSSGPAGASWNSRIHLYFNIGNADMFSYKDVDIVILREGISIRLYLNGEEQKLDNPAEMPEPIVGTDSDGMLEIPGQSWVYMDKAYISEIDISGDDIVDASGTYTGLPNDYKFNHDLDLYDSYFNFKSYFPDNKGSFARVDNTSKWMGEGGTAGARSEWSQPPTLTKSNGYIPKTSCLKLTGNAVLSTPQIDFTKDFTLSFWVNYLHPKTFLTFDGGSDVLFGYVPGNQGKLPASGWQFDFGGNDQRLLALEGNDGDHENTWNHVAIVKCGDNIGVWTNSKCNKWSVISVTQEQQSTIGICTPKFKPFWTTGDLYLSHMKIAQYAVCNVPIDNIGQKSSWTAIDELKTTSDTQRLMPYIPDWVQ